MTAVEAEAAALRAGLGPRSTGIEVVAAGVGSAVAAAATARQLAVAAGAGRPYQAVVSAGIGGGFPDRVDVAATVLATSSIAADLGAESPTGFIGIDELGFGSAVAATDATLTNWLRGALPHAVAGQVLTVNTVTGTEATATALAVRHPDALAEAMEGYGVACAAALARLPFAELRTISNPVGPRDRSRWRIPAALAALTAAGTALDRTADQLATVVGWP
ncbi:futalosine hydrolase [Solwaraspora sp. WMMD406]|uniref:futalosine hydrolase n=1 Tax=Solwaraspora sp. WMMD406 TaxID=3016095 RepID=UPI002416F6F7|nr:futalosine hydrolase [Solwaraspora sp. WMMD406]MDG4763468.1 futalosine hydrolase [Solwaraspora sp. WMMD406]